MGTTTKKTTTKKFEKKAGKRSMSRSAVRAAVAGKKAGKVKAVRKSRSAGLIKQDSRMTPGRGWRLSPDGGKTVFTATLVTTHDLGDRIVAIFKTRA